jgi:putative transposase
MKLEISVPEVVDIFKEIKDQPEQLYEMIRTDIRQIIGQYLSGLMDVGLTHFLGRNRYEHRQGMSIIAMVPTTANLP